ncbi:hypothetical protein ACLEPN_01360 [Myxococcus sp. 1LA]
MPTPMMEHLADGDAAAAFIAVAALGLCGAMLHEAWRGTKARWARTASIFVMGLVLVLAALPALETVLPGQPLAAVEVTEKGQSIPLPPSVNGRVLVVVRGRLAQTGNTEILFSIAGMEEMIRGTLERSRTYIRAKRGRTHVWRNRLSFHQRGSIPRGVHALTVEQLEGSLEGPLRVEFYRNRWPPLLVAWAAGLVLLTASVLHARLQLRRYALFAGTALGTSLFIYNWGEPRADITFAAACLFLGFTVGAPIGWLASQALRTRSPSPARRRRNQS